MPIAQPTGAQRARIVDAYLTALQRVFDAGFVWEVHWQTSRDIARLTEGVLLREIAWVVLSAGMAERVVRRVFPAVESAFLDWKSARAIVEDSERCAIAAMAHFSHAGKVGAIVSAARLISEAGFERVQQSIQCEGTSFLEQFDYVGPVTSFHLAKNLGADVVKPDRHLIRAANAAGVESPDALCKLIADATGDRISTVDLVIW